MTACGIGEIIDLRLVDLYPLAYKTSAPIFGVNWSNAGYCDMVLTLTSKNMHSNPTGL